MKKINIIILIVALVIISIIGFVFYKNRNAKPLEEGDIQSQQQEVKADFSKTGNITKSESKINLIYEEPGKPALSANLVFNENSKCESATGEKTCVLTDLKDGDRISVEGKLQADNSVEVIKLTINQENNNMSFDIQGMKVEIIKEGTGESAKNGNIVSANYIGTLENGKKFDSSYDRGEPFSFTLGKGEVIKGLEEGVSGMREGGKRLIIIPPNLGYGETGAGNAIPPNSELYFTVQLIAVY